MTVNRFSKRKGIRSVAKTREKETTPDDGGPRDRQLQAVYYFELDFLTLLAVFHC